MSQSDVFEVLRLAAHHDTCNRLKEACFMYLLACDLLTDLAATETHPRKKEIMENKIQEYRQRAQQINVEATQGNRAPTSPTDLADEVESSSHSENNKLKAKNALKRVKMAKELQAQGPASMKMALQKYDEALQMLEQVLAASSDETLNQSIRVRLSFIQNCADHLRAHSLAKSKFRPESLELYAKADAGCNKAIQLDEQQQIEEACRVYKLSAQILRQALEKESDTLLKKVMVKRIHLCQKRIEQLSHASDIGKLATVKGREYHLEAGEARSPGRLDQFSSTLKSAMNSNPTEGVVGKMIDEHPDHHGEWLTEVAMEGTRTMRDPLDPSLQYTVYMMKITSKVVEDGVVIDTPVWNVIRRFYQFKLLHSKLKSIKVDPLPEFPASHLLVSEMDASVIQERTQIFRRYFHSLLHRPPNPELNSILLRFLRNTFKREEANE